LERGFLQHRRVGMTSGGNLPAEPLPPAAQERVVEILTRHFANDVLTEGELDARLQRVYAAKTARELDAIVADLPAAPAVEVPRMPAREPRGAPITALLSGQERKLSGVVPREMKVRARLGYVELDLTRAKFEPGVTTIDVRAFMGYVQVRFPAGVRVESEGWAILGFFALKGGGSSGAVEPGGEQSIVRITGRAIVGFAECFTPSQDALPAGEVKRLTEPHR
jgi:hypothetical protein